jgi:hypothetical protein
VIRQAAAVRRVGADGGHGGGRGAQEGREAESPREARVRGQPPHRRRLAVVATTAGRPPLLGDHRARECAKNEKLVDPTHAGFHALIVVSVQVLTPRKKKGEKKIDFCRCKRAHFSAHFSGAHFSVGRISAPAFSSGGSGAYIALYNVLQSARSTPLGCFFIVSAVRPFRLAIVKFRSHFQPRSGSI